MSTTGNHFNLPLEQLPRLSGTLLEEKSASSILDQLKAEYHNAIQTFCQISLNPNTKYETANINFSSLVFKLEDCITQLPLNEALEIFEHFHDFFLNYSSNPSSAGQSQPLAPEETFQGTNIEFQKRIIEKLTHASGLLLQREEIEISVIQPIFETLQSGICYYSRIVLAYAEREENDETQLEHCLDVVTDIDEYIQALGEISQDFCDFNVNNINTSSLYRNKVQHFLRISKLLIKKDDHLTATTYIQECYEILEAEGKNENAEDCNLLEECEKLESAVGYLKQKPDFKTESQNHKELKGKFQIMRSAFNKYIKDNQDIEIISIIYNDFYTHTESCLLVEIPGLMFSSKTDIGLFSYLSESLISSGWHILKNYTGDKNNNSIKNILVKIAETINQYAEIALEQKNSTSKRSPLNHNKAASYIENFLENLRNFNINAEILESLPIQKLEENLEKIKTKLTITSAESKSQSEDNAQSFTQESTQKIIQIFHDYLNLLQENNSEQTKALMRLKFSLKVSILKLEPAEGCIAFEALKDCFLNNQANPGISSSNTLLSEVTKLFFEIGYNLIKNITSIDMDTIIIDKDREIELSEEKYDMTASIFEILQSLSVHYGNINFPCIEQSLEKQMDILNQLSEFRKKTDKIINIFPIWDVHMDLLNIITVQHLIPSIKQLTEIESPTSEQLETIVRYLEIYQSCLDEINPDRLNENKKMLELFQNIEKEYNEMEGKLLAFSSENRFYQSLKKTPIDLTTLSLSSGSLMVSEHASEATKQRIFAHLNLFLQNYGGNIASESTSSYDTICSNISHYKELMEINFSIGRHLLSNNPNLLQFVFDNLTQTADHYRVLSLEYERQFLRIRGIIPKFPEDPLQKVIAVNQHQNNIKTINLSIETCYHVFLNIIDKIEEIIESQNNHSTLDLTNLTKEKIQFLIKTSLFIINTYNEINEEQLKLIESNIEDCEDFLEESDSENQEDNIELLRRSLSELKEKYERIPKKVVKNVQKNPSKKSFRLSEKPSSNEQGNTSQDNTPKLTDAEIVALFSDDKKPQKQSNKNQAKSNKKSNTNPSQEKSPKPDHPKEEKKKKGTNAKTISQNIQEQKPIAESKNPQEEKQQTSDKSDTIIPNVTSSITVQNTQTESKQPKQKANDIKKRTKKLEKIDNDIKNESDPIQIIEFIKTLNRMKNSDDYQDPALHARCCQLEDSAKDILQGKIESVDQKDKLEEILAYIQNDTEKQVQDKLKLILFKANALPACLRNTQARYKNVIDQLAELIRTNGYTFNAYLFGSSIYKSSPGDMDFVITHSEGIQVNEFIQALIANGGQLITAPHRIDKEKRTIYKLNLLGIDVDINAYDDPDMDIQALSAKTDFTIGAAYYDVRSGEILYPHSDTQADIENKKLRTVIDPVTSFQTDPTRILRAIRMLSSSEFTLDQTTQAAIAQMASSDTSVFDNVNKDKLYQQMELLFYTGHAVDNLQNMEQYGLLDHFFCGLKTLGPIARENTLYLLRETAQKLDADFRASGMNTNPISLIYYAAHWEAMRGIGFTFEDASNDAEIFRRMFNTPYINLQRSETDPLKLNADAMRSNKGYLENLENIRSNRQAVSLAGNPTIARNPNSFYFATAHSSSQLTAQARQQPHQHQNYAGGTKP